MGPKFKCATFTPNAGNLAGQLVYTHLAVRDDKLCKDNCLQACVTDKLDNSDRINLAMHHA
jgi:hypothetical protein